MWFRRSKVLFLRIARATDSFIAAPILIALVIVLGDAGLPGNCDQLYEFNSHAYDPSQRRIATEGRQACNANGTIDRSNDCGTGRRQVHAINAMCQQAKAGFGLTIAAM